MRKTAVLVVALVLLAGCANQGAVTAPEKQAATTQSGGDAQRVAVTEAEGTLGDVNATAVWLRVVDLTSLESASPPDVTVLSREPGTQATPTRFQRSFGAENYTVDSSLASGKYRPQWDTVSITRTPNSTDDQMETVLAHEFAHVLQYRHLLDFFPSDDGLSTQTVVEGAAEYVQWQYAEQYGSYDPEARGQRLFSDWPPVGKLFQARYYLGAQWIRNHSDPGAPLASTQRNPPRTAEEVLHDLPPGSEPPRELTVHGDSGTHGAFYASNPERRGEAELRFLLEHGLPTERAAAAAAGWGNDQWLRAANTSGDGYAWVVRWDSPAEASEFEAAFTDFQANVSEPLALQTVGDETTVVLSGREAFVENAIASGTAGNVTVAAGD